MAQRAPGTRETAVITNAPYPKTLDVEARTRRYLWTMGLRVVCFVAMALLPGVWLKLACAIGAAVLPAIAVLLANASDNHKPPVAPAEPDPSPLLALAGGETIRGVVVDE